MAGRDTAEVLRVSSRYLSFEPPEVTDYFTDNIPFTLGPFRITAHLVDHSAYDAYAFMVEAGGRRLFYSGDFRGHGRKSGIFDAMVRKPPEGVNALLLEGTSIGRENPSHPDEQSVQHKATEVLRATKGLVLAMYSPQNVDRLVSLYRAAKRAGRTLVIDLYAAELVRSLNRDSIPQPGWNDIRVYIPHSQRTGVIKSEEFGRVDAVRDSRIFQDEMLKDPGRFAVTFRSSMVPEMAELLATSDSAALWMMWPGYLEDGRDHILDLLERFDIPTTIAHCSGHARVEHLQALAAAISADKVVPVHSDFPELFSDFFSDVQQHADGEWWDV